MINSNRELKAILKSLTQYKVISFEKADLRIYFHPAIDNSKPHSIYYRGDSNEKMTEVIPSSKESDEAETIMKDLEDENLLINDPEEYERKQRENV